MRTILNGTLTLGQLAIPVALAPAIRDQSPTFRVLHEACQTRIANRPWCGYDEQLLDPADLVHAWEPAPGEYLVLDENERAALEPPASRQIPISGFVRASELEPALARKRYWLAPSTTRVGQAGYATLAAAMGDLQVVALARFTAWQTEQLAEISARPDGLLQLATLNFAEDLAEQPDPVDHDVDQAELELATELVHRHTRKLRPHDLASLWRPRVRALLEAKLAGQTIIRPEPADDDVDEPEPGHIDLAHALRASLKQAPRQRRRTTAAASR